MKLSGANVHATAIIAGTQGILFVGPSASGKSSLAFSCLQRAKAGGEFSALVADDRVDIRTVNGHVLAHCPPTIFGLMEVRYAAIVKMRAQASTRLQFAVLAVSPQQEPERLPPDDESLQFEDGGCLPLLRLAKDTLEPLAALRALFQTRQNLQA